MFPARFRPSVQSLDSREMPAALVLSHAVVQGFAIVAPPAPVGAFQNGVAPEYMTALANELHADAWLNMPHMAEDDYVRSFSTVVRSQVVALPKTTAQPAIATAAVTPLRMVNA